MKEYVLNEQIRAPEIRVIDLDGTQLGIMETKEAIALARSKSIDLVLLAPNEKPPVCRLLDYGKFKYAEEKKEREARRKQKSATVLKELKFSPKISEHDYQVRVNHAKEFLIKGHKVKISLRFRGREMTHQDIGQRIVTRITNDVQGTGVPESAMRLEGKSLILVIAPVRRPTKVATHAA